MAGELGFDTGPFINVATFCDAVIEGKDNVLSLIRLVDGISIETHGPDAPDDLPSGFVVDTRLVIILRAGRARGSQKVQVVLERPDGSRTEGPIQSVTLMAAPGAGANIIMPMRLEVLSPGLHWADVLVNDRLMSRVPLNVTYRFTR